MPVSISGNTGITFPDGSLQTAAASPLVLRNRIINGDMRIDQRNAGASVTPTASGYTLDRWRAGLSVSSKFSVQQTTTAPTGFNYSLKATSLSAYTVGAAETFIIGQYIEGYNFADLGWGTANAKTITLSFWVQSSLTGTFGGSIRNDTPDRSYPFTYTISAANTWEYKTITIAGDTTGTWLTTNGTGAIITWALGAGSSFSGTAGAWAAGNYTSATGAVSVVGTNGATFYITGVQLEQNTSATPFERRLYNQELANCQRYYWQQGFTTTYETILDPARISGTAEMQGQIYYHTTMRVSPTFTTNGVGNFRLNNSLGQDQVCNGITAPYISPDRITLAFTKATANLTVAGTGYINTEVGNDAYLYFNAEL